MSHFDGKRFFNPGAPPARGLKDVLRWKFASRAQRSPKFANDVEPAIPPRKVEGGALAATLINHSTVLIQHGGVNILTDPVWSYRISPVSWAGPARHRIPGVRWEDLPPIQIALITHNHYDHLDVNSLTRLMEDHRPAFVAPARLGEYLDRIGIGPVHELDWAASVTLSGTVIRCVPAIHFSGRGLFDRNRTLWCGYVIEADAGPIYFAGDTAFGPHFSSIRKRYGELRLAFLPIGAYRPRWMMSRVHMNPEEALRAHDILCAKTSVAIHHGTFQISDESIDAPVRELAFRMERKRPQKPFVVLANGQSLSL